MKYLKLFEDFKDTSAARADAILKQIDKNLRYNLKYGTLHKNGFTFINSDIFDNNGPYDWLKIEICLEQEKDDYLFGLIFMMDEEYLGVDAKEGDEKIHVEIAKYKLPEYKKIASFKDDFPLNEVFADDFIFSKIEEVNKKVLKVPKDHEDYLKNLDNQIDTVDQFFEPSEEIPAENTETEAPPETT